MVESRGRKSKKGRWQLILGVKETLFALVGIVGLMMMSFAVGTLAGRGDIYRVLHNWGLLGPEAKTLQPWNLPHVAIAPGPAVPQTIETAPASLVPVSPPLPAAPSGALAPAVPAPAAPPAKKAKANASRKDHKSREEELRRMREEVAKKLKFQNSLDTAAVKPKTREPKARQAEKKAGPPAPIMVAKYRDKKAAVAKVAELQKQGEQATIKEGKDDKGPYFAVYRKKSADPPKPSNGGQAKPGIAATKLKKRGE